MNMRLAPLKYRRTAEEGMIYGGCNCGKLPSDHPCPQAMCTPAAVYRTAGWETCLKSGWQISGYARWSGTVIIQNLKNAANASFWLGVGDVPLLPAAETVIFTGQIPSAGRRLDKMNEVISTILRRRSIRRFERRQIEEDILDEILQAGLYAPSAGGRQGVIFAVCQDREVNERLGKIKRANSHPCMAAHGNYVSREQPSIADDPKLTNAFYDAPTVITMFAPKNFLFSPEDCAAAAENMMLAADSLGVGSCYIGQGWTAFGDPYGQEILRKWKIPENLLCCDAASSGLSKRRGFPSAAEAAERGTHTEILSKGQEELKWMPECV